MEAPMRTILTLLLAANTAFAEPTMDERRKQFERADGTRVVYEILNLDCTGCPLKLRKAMEDEPGVNAVLVDADTSTLNVAFDPEKTDTEKLTAAIDDSGFRRKVAAGAPGPLPAPKN